MLIPLMLIRILLLITHIQIKSLCYNSWPITFKFKLYKNQISSHIISVHSSVVKAVNQLIIFY